MHGTEPRLGRSARPAEALSAEVVEAENELKNILTQTDLARSQIHNLGTRTDTKIFGSGDEERPGPFSLLHGMQSIPRDIAWQLERKQITDPTIADAQTVSALTQIATLYKKLHAAQTKMIDALYAPIDDQKFANERFAQEISALKKMKQEDVAARTKTAAEELRYVGKLAHYRDNLAAGAYEEPVRTKIEALLRQFDTLDFEVTDQHDAIRVREALRAHTSPALEQTVRAKPPQPAADHTIEVPTDVNWDKRAA